MHPSTAAASSWPRCSAPRPCAAPSARQGLVQRSLHLAPHACTDPPHPSPHPTPQVLFIDADDVLRGRLAAALFERISEWNGYGRVLLPWTCGVDADQGGACGDLSTQAALMFKARALGLRARAFTRPTERFEAADLDRWGARVDGGLGLWGVRAACCCTVACFSCAAWFGMRQWRAAAGRHEGGGGCQQRTPSARPCFHQQHSLSRSLSDPPTKPAPAPPKPQTHTPPSTHTPLQPPPHKRHDVLVAVDRATKDAILRLVDPRYRDYYDAQVRLLSEYGSPGLLQVRWVDEWVGKGSWWCGGGVSKRQ